MSIIDKLKNLKGYIPKITTEELRKQDNTSLKDVVNTNLKDIEEIHHPGIGPAKEDYILLDTFLTKFERDCFIKPEQIFAVTKPSYDVDNSSMENKFKISFTMVNAKYYIGKPSEYTNFKLDKEILDQVKRFNLDTPEWFEITEYGDESNIPRLTTRYTGLRITKIEFPEFNTMTGGGIMKYYTVTISYDKVMSVSGEFEKENKE